jgi:hypothetical protein
LPKRIWFTSNVLRIWCVIVGMVWGAMCDNPHVNRPNNWWDELEMVYDYDLETLQQAVLDMKNKKSNGLILSAESYDFVLFLGQYV